MSDPVIKTEEKERALVSSAISKDTSVKNEKLDIPAVKLADPETSSQASSLTLVKQENVESRAQNKRKNLETSDDEEDFAGFDKSK